MPASRFNSVGLAGRKDSDNNSQDSFLKTYEFPVVAVASAAAQDTGVAVPAGFFQCVSALIVVDEPEVTGASKTVTVGTTVDGQAILGSTDVSSPGPVGTPGQGATAGGGTFTYTLGGADFVELDAKAVVTIVASEA